MVNEKGKKEYFVGLDLSLTATGLIVLDNKKKIIEQKIISTSSKNSCESRINEIIENISFISNIVSLGGFNIEGLSFASSGHSILELAGLHYSVRHFFYKNNISFNIVPPTSLKKFVSGKGNVKKEVMLKEVYKRWNVDFNDNNLADAYGLARMALET